VPCRARVGRQDHRRGGPFRGCVDRIRLAHRGLADQVRVSRTACRWPRRGRRTAPWPSTSWPRRRSCRSSCHSTPTRCREVHREDRSPWWCCPRPAPGRLDQPDRCQVKASALLATATSDQSARSTALVPELLDLDVAVRRVVVAWIAQLRQEHAGVAAGAANRDSSRTAIGRMPPRQRMEGSRFSERTRIRSIGDTRREDPLTAIQQAAMEDRTQL